MEKMEIQSSNQALKQMMLSLSQASGWERSEGMTQESIAAFPHPEQLGTIKSVILVGHGTSLATAMNGEFLFSTIASIQARAVPAYQFLHYSRQYLVEPETTLVVGISCNGNTVSVARSLQTAREAGAHTMCISGNGDIALPKWSEYRVRAYTEIEKENNMSAYSASHLFILYGAFQAALCMGEQKGIADRAYWGGQWEDLKETLGCLPDLFDTMSRVAGDYAAKSYHNLAVLGTGPNYGTAQEGALKICEMAWMFTACEELEDFAHGRFREVDGLMPLFVVAPHARTLPKVLDILAGCHYAQTPSVIFTQESDPALGELSETIISMPAIREECLTPFLYVFPLWFFGFHMRNNEGKLVGEKRFGLTAPLIDYGAYKARKQ